jgi:hypothetical protein
MTLFIHGADPRTAGVGIPATVRDSVLGRVTISPIGQEPVPLVVTLTLNRD